MATVSEIVVRIQADVKGLQSGLLKGGTELKAFSATANKTAADSTVASSKIGGAFSGVSSTLTRLAPAFIAIGGIAVAAIVKGISATTQWASDVRSLQRVTGQTAESASALAGAAAQLGIPVSQLSTGFGLLAKNIVNGSAGLTKYGIATRDASGQILPFDSVLAAVSEKFNSLPNATEKAAFAQNVFGRSGKNLIPILSQGAAGLAELEKKAGDLHLVMSQQALDDAKNLSVAERQLGLAFKGASISIGQDFIPLATTSVHVFTAVLEGIAAIPQPLKIAVLGFSVLTGAIAATVKVGGFFADTWKKVLNVTSNAAQLDTAAQGAGHLTDAFSQTSQELANLANILTATRGSVIAAGAPVGALAVGIKSEADAALAAQLASTKFSQATSGLIVPTTSLANASQNAASGITATGAAAGGLTLGGAVTILGALAVTAGFVAIQMRDAKGAVDQFGAAVTSKLGQLAQGGDFAKAVRQLARQPLPTQAAPGAGPGLSGGLFNQVQAIKEARQALDEWRQAQLLASESSSKLATSIRGILKPVQDLTTPLKEVPGLLGQLNGAAANATSGLDKLSTVSGQDFSSIRDELAKTLNDPKTTVGQLPAIFGAALGKVKEQMNAWHDSVVENFGGAQAAVSQFLGQAAGTGPNKVSFNNLTKSLADTQAQLHRWSSDFSTILHSSGDKANKFLQDMSANGLQSVGILDVVAQQPKKIRDAFLKQYNDVNKQTDSIASKITDAFGQAARDIIDKLNQLIRAVQGKPIHVHADTTQARQSIHDLAVALAGVRDKDITVRFHQVGSVQHPLPFHSGGLVFHEGGAVPASAEVLRHAKRMHVGGLGADEVPIIAQRGEFVVRRTAVAKPGVLPMLRAVNRMHDGGHVIERLKTAERFHEGGTVERIRSSALLRESRFHTGGLTERFRSSERFHDGGMTVVQPPPSRASSEGIEEALRRAIRAEMADAVAKGVKEVREKLYVDRRRFGRDLDQNVLTDGHW